MNIKHTLLALATPLIMNAQKVMTPELMWSLKRLNIVAVSPEQSSLIYKVSQTDLKTEKK